MKSLIRHSILFLALSVACGLAIAQQPESASPAAPSAQTQSEPQKTEGAAQPVTQEQKQSGSEAKSQEGQAKQETAEEEEENAALKYPRM